MMLLKYGYYFMRLEDKTKLLMIKLLSKNKYLDILENWWIKLN